MGGVLNDDILPKAADQGFEITIVDRLFKPSEDTLCSGLRLLLNHSTTPFSPRTLGSAKAYSLSPSVPYSTGPQNIRWGLVGRFRTD